jgi:hypothetical protein
MTVITRLFDGKHCRQALDGGILGYNRQLSTLLEKNAKMEKALRLFLGTLLLVIALNAFGGGYYGMIGAEGVPVDWLDGSPFTSYFIPSLFLFVVIGGACLLAAVMVFRNSVHAASVAFACAGLLLGWVVLQVVVIGYVSWLQPAIFISAIVIGILAYLMPDLHLCDRNRLAGLSDAGTERGTGYNADGCLTASSYRLMHF